APPAHRFGPGRLPLPGWQFGIAHPAPSEDRQSWALPPAPGHSSSARRETLSRVFPMTFVDSSSHARLPPAPFERAPAGRLYVLGAELSQFLAGSSVQLLVALMTLLGQAPEGKQRARRAASYAQCVPTFQ